jgi:hypothetical protein
MADSSVRRVISPIASALVVVAGTVGLATVLGSSPAEAITSPSCATADGVTSCTFAYNGTNGSDGIAQTWTVPNGVTQVTVTADGAEGAPRAWPAAPLLREPASKGVGRAAR